MTREEKVVQILNRLYKVYPAPKTALHYQTPFELLIATILSAQATDKLVNQVTPGLFKAYPGPDAFAHASIDEIDTAIRRINFHHNKAKSIKGASEKIVKEYGGNVPQTMEELITLPGVARKTANVVLGSAFDRAEGVVVDTHVMRLVQKLGLTHETKPEKIEQDLMKIVPKEKWIDFSLLLINFGREYCPARAHVCQDCPLGNLCPDKG